MLSFPAPKWTVALSAVPKTKNTGPPGSRFGRVASLITPRVYLSDYFTARDVDELTRLGITHVISVLEHDPVIPDLIPGERRLHIRIQDRSDADILTHLDETTKFIISALEENETNKVLVHCFQGISRSATVVCAYLVASSNMLASEALAHVQAKRGIVCPNIGFRNQLETYAQRFVGKHFKRGENRVARISGDIAGRIRQLRAISRPTSGG